MSEATILKLAEYAVDGVMAVAFFGFLSFVFWLRHKRDMEGKAWHEFFKDVSVGDEIDAAVQAGHKRMEKWESEHGFHKPYPKGK